MGRDIEPVIRRFLSNMPQRFEVAKNDVRLHGALVEIDEATGKASKIQRVAQAIWALEGSGVTVGQAKR